ncbi:hypothetical protein SAMN05519104_0176 [Rhizobiales bacterium GAS188]|nr:hypothetical protein SAMN05519104_0176 [Rhizobiales bacterium GAS188]
MARASSPTVTKSKAAPGQDAGYSGTPLAAKLGLKDGQVVVFVALPEHLGGLAEARSFASVSLVAKTMDLRLPPRSVDLIHAFFTDAAALRTALPLFREAISDAGSIWISWPKKTSPKKTSPKKTEKSAKVAGDLGEDAVRRAALSIELVDIKVCAVDAVWSGLKLVIPRAKRAQHSS